MRCKFLRGEESLTQQIDRIAQKIRERLELDSISQLQPDFSTQSKLENSIQGPSYLDADLFDQAMKTKAALILECEDRSLEDYYQTDVVETAYGSCLKNHSSG